MIFYKESKKFLNKENIDYIENTILSPSFPFYLSKSSTPKACVSCAELLPNIGQ